MVGLSGTMFELRRSGFTLVGLSAPTSSRRISSATEHFIGNEEVPGLIPGLGMCGCAVFRERSAQGDSGQAGSQPEAVGGARRTEARRRLGES